MKLAHLKQRLMVKFRFQLNNTNSKYQKLSNLMTNKSIIQTDDAPKAIGTYSQAVKVGHTVYLSGQIPLDPEIMALVPGDFAEQTKQVFKNLRSVCRSRRSLAYDRDPT